MPCYLLHMVEMPESQPYDDPDLKERIFGRIKEECEASILALQVITGKEALLEDNPALKRSIQYAAGGATFSYFKLKKECYFGFTKIGPFFMAQKEKAFLDACHLSAYGRYAFDRAALDMDRLDKAVLETLMAPFPERTRNRVKDIWGVENTSALSCRRAPR